jgi:hypothetical protein
MLMLVLQRLAIAPLRGSRFPLWPMSCMIGVGLLHGVALISLYITDQMFDLGKVKGNLMRAISPLALWRYLVLLRRRLSTDDWSRAWVRRWRRLPAIASRRSGSCDALLQTKLDGGSRQRSRAFSSGSGLSIRFGSEDQGRASDCDC